ncbi:CAP domain-containing protein [Arsenicibacter rosenii]|uniref:Uncharacterized protein n=1 Tax=Arsenicibacter rosenii TaxID=1750698 RepID=A0A1S2VMM4_9BACT|nr:CAP domain-containing protein [Arsenicibacter rosenii]OIN59465.1 hypothetical protein BLX24_10880 [Arsenicibacter rosenii]
MRQLHFYRILAIITLCGFFVCLTPLTANAQVVNEPILNEAPKPANPLDTSLFSVPFNKAVSQPWNRTAIITDYIQNFVGSSVSVSELGWTGSVSGCVAGSISALAQNRVIQRINYYRRLVGLPDNMTLDPSRNAATQEAALMMLANNSLSHSPPTSWLCYTATGAAGAGSSNIAIGSFAANAIKLYMDDPGSGNEPAGHRRWILYSRANSFGTGSTNNSDALWVFNAFSTPAGLPPYVAYPPAGYVPRALVPQRWSISIPSANFTNATVQVMDDTNAPVAVTRYTPTNGYGDNTLVWDLTNPGTALAWNGSADKTFSVQVSGVVINGITQSPYSYTVVAIDPNTFCPYPTPVAACSVTANNSPSIYYGVETFRFNTIDVTSGSASNEGLTYVDRTCLNSTTVTAGNSYSMTLKGAFSNTHTLKAYIDFNNNGQFTDAGEQVLSAVSANTQSVTIPIPQTAVANTPLRIRVLADAPNTSASGPCLVAGSNSFGAGQIEDFTVFVQGVSCNTMYTVKAGNWNDPTVWSCNRIPVATDAVELRHAVAVPDNLIARALKITYQAGQTLTLGTNARLLLNQ